MSDEPPTERFDQPPRGGAPDPDATQAYPRQPDDPARVRPPQPTEATRAYSSVPRSSVPPDAAGETDATEIFAPLAAEPPRQPPSGPRRSDPQPPERRSHALLITLICIGAALLVAIVVLLVMLLVRDAGSDTVATHSTSISPSATPSTTPSTPPSPSTSPTPSTTPTTPPAPTDPQITSFTVSTSVVTCTPGSTQQPPLTFSWTSTGATAAYFGVDTPDASTAPYFQALPPNGDTSDFPSGNNPFGYACPAGTHNYTLTVVGNGEKSSQIITVVNNAAQ